MPKWVCFKLKNHVSLVRCCPHPKLVSPDKMIIIIIIKTKQNKTKTTKMTIKKKQKM